MHLIERFTDRHPALFQFNLHQRQAVDQNGDIISVGMGACLFKLLNDLQLVIANVRFVHQIDVLDTACIKNKIMDVIIMNFAGLVDQRIAGPVQVFGDKSRPFCICEGCVVEPLQLHPRIVQHRRWGGKTGQIVITLALKIGDQFPFQVCFVLIAVLWFPVPLILIENDEVLGFSDGGGLLGHRVNRQEKSDSWLLSDQAVA